MSRFWLHFLGNGRSYQYESPRGRTRTQAQSARRSVRSGLGILGREVALNPAWTKVLPNARTQGIEVIAIDPDSPAEEAGLQAGDILLALNDQATETLQQTQALASRLPLGIPALALWLRQDRPISRFLIPAEAPTRDSR